MVRTFSNSIEACFLMIGLYVWNKIPSGELTRSLLSGKALLMTFLITASFIMRNSSAVGWLPLVFYKVFYQRNFKMFVISGFLIAVPMLVLAVAADSWFYGKLTFTHWNFLKFNVIDEGSSSFGVDPWH